MTRKVCAMLFLILAFLVACASKPPPVPYPVFMQVAGIPDSFLATLPGTRAKILSSDPHSRRISMRLALPADFKFGTGGEPNKSLEIYVLEGELTLGEFTLEPGGYAFLPSGSMGVSMASSRGAVLLYFLDDVHPAAAIQTPIINNSNLLGWTAASDGVDGFGLSYKELRSDPGSGARTWLLRVEPGATLSWQSANTVEEGYLVSGQYRHAECASGVPSPGEYVEGGYYLRAADWVNGGPTAAAVETSVWIVRVPESVTYTYDLYCGVVSE